MLYIVPTPIGNLKDLSYRSVEVLKKVDLILAEDTRNSGKLLKTYNIDTPMSSFHAHNEHARLEGVMKQLQQGTSIALITDAGMPGISDPGYLLIREAIRFNIEVDILPGPSAFILGLLHSGFPCNKFQFIGFLPTKKGRQTALKEASSYRYTTVLYESSHRIKKLITQLSDIMPQRWVSISRELTKLHQTITTAPVETIHETMEQGAFTTKGEFVVTIAPEDFKGFE